MSGFKTCAVPLCPNNNKKVPSKYYFIFPFGRHNEKIRNVWFDAINRDSNVSPKSKFYCCKDHFTIEKDTVNYYPWRTDKTIKLKLKTNVTPHRFDCQKHLNKYVRSQSTKKIKSLTQPSTTNVKERVDAENDPPEKKYSSHNHFWDTNSLTESPVLYIKQEVIEHTEEKDNSCNIDSNQSIQDHLYVKKEIDELEEFMGDRFAPQYTADKNVQVNRDEFQGEKGVQIGEQTKRAFSSSVFPSESPTKWPDGTEVAQPVIRSIKKKFESTNNKGVFLSSPGNSVFVETIEKNPLIFLGLPSESYYLVNILEKSIHTSVKDIFVTLKKIRLNQSFELLSVYFELEVSVVFKIFRRTVLKMTPKMKQLIYWPSTDEIRQRMPVPFQARFSRVESIIDFLEIQIKRPKHQLTHSLMQSFDNKCNTIKYLISYTPDGFINFVSRGYKGHVSDLVEKCGYLNKLSDGMCVMIDRDFSHLSPLIENVGCKLVKLPVIAANEPITKEEVRLAKRNAAVGIHVKRVIEQLHEFHILQPHACIEIEQLDLIDDIVVIACAILNMQS